MEILQGHRSWVNLKTQKTLLNIFFICLLAGICGYIWIFIEADILGSSDPNIGAAGLTLMGFLMATITGFLWLIAFLASKAKSKNKPHEVSR